MLWLDESVQNSLVAGASLAVKMQECVWWFREKKTKSDSICTKKTLSSANHPNLVLVVQRVVVPEV